ncbi:TetR/AcrR family transcriptional regulator [Rhizohabitans arisaemae]|uniref:TetR/AcrR family transcriptional regulator n=1 Tax=Rhizohabitans arisaemae TaxID=2720610 RepID=UPI0024B03CA0|nr:TetR/AcrR family transcriptional regulator [Rhizohabitans arisaemae]
MSPRGVAIPEVRRQLFDAAERVLAREGPAGLSGRAITREAGCATGLLYNHFGDLDRFLTELFLDRALQASAELGELIRKAGTATVADNLANAIDALFGTNLLALAGLALVRPSLTARLHESVGEGVLRLDLNEAVLTAYLDAERDLGRIRPDTDTGSLAVALAGSAHQLLLTGGPHAPDLRERMRRVVNALVAGIAP